MSVIELGYEEKGRPWWSLCILLPVWYEGTCMEAVQVGHRDDEGGHAEQEQEQHLPHPEPVVGRRSQPNTAAANFSNTTLRGQVVTSWPEKLDPLKLLYLPLLRATNKLIS